MAKKDRLIDRLRRSAKDAGELYPVLIDENGEILDGRSRLKANPNWHKKELTGLDPLEKLKVKYHANWHRKDINRQKVLTEIAEETGWRGLKPFAEFLDVSERTISTYLPQEYKIKASGPQQKSDIERPLIKKLEKASNILAETKKAVEKANCAEEKKQEITDTLKSTEETLSNFLDEIGVEQPNIEAQIGNWLNDIEWQYSLWECQDERPEGFGDKTFHGNCSPSLIFAVLKRYSTLSDDLILDPMAGSGTFVDVARTLGYRDDQILVRDIKPLRNDIEFGDAENTKLESESVDFIFAHFPYWKLIPYSDNRNDLSILDFKLFVEKSENIIKEMHRILKKKHFFVVMIGNLRKKGVVDLEAQFSVIGSRYFTLWDKIVKRIRTWKPETRGQRMGLAIARGRQHGYTVVNHDTILVFRKD